MMYYVCKKKGGLFNDNVNLDWGEKQGESRLYWEHDVIVKSFLLGGWVKYCKVMSGQ